MPSLTAHPRMVPSIRKYVDEIQLAWGSYPSANDPRQRYPESPGTADFHLDPWERYKLINKSRAVERENEWYDATLTNYAVLAVGPHGPEPAIVSDKITEEQKKAIIRQWWLDSDAKKLDVSGLRNWGAMLRLEVISLNRDGEMLVWHNGKGAVLHYESDQVGRVHRNADLKEIEYELNKVAENGLVLTPNAGGGAKISANRCNFMRIMTRFGQSRGAPALQQSLTRWARLSSLAESEIISAEAASLPWTVLKESPDAGPGGLDRIPYSDDENEEGEGEGGASVDYVAPEPPAGWQPSDAGHMFAPPPGVEAQPWIPNRPNLNVPEFIKQMLRRFTAKLLPYEILFNDLGAMNYSASQRVAQEANDLLAAFRPDQLEPRCDQQFTEWLSARATDFGVNAEDLEDIRVEWNWPKIKIKDRAKEAAADKLELENGTITLEMLVGSDWRNVQDQRFAEKQRALELEAKLAQMRLDIMPVEQAPRPTAQEMASVDSDFVARVKHAVEATTAAGISEELPWPIIIAASAAQSAPGAFLQATLKPTEEGTENAN